jgi:hypothetical protein
MDTERQFLHKISTPLASAVLLGETIRFSLEGVLKTRATLEDLAMKLQESHERLSALVEERRASLKRASAPPKP